MKHTFLRSFSMAALLAALFVFLMAGCGDDDPVIPDPLPELALNLTCDTGIIGLELRNTGGAMPEAGLFEAVFADGERDTLFLQVGAQDSLSCQLSNIHGAVVVTNEKWGLTASADDCLVGTLEGLMAEFDMGSLIPRPLVSQDITVCTYTIYLNNLTHDPPVFELVPNDSGLILKYVFNNIHADIRAIGSNWACADLNGDLDIDSVVSETQIIINEGGDPEVSLGETETSVVGMDVDIDGVLGFLGGWIINMFEGDFADALEDAITQEIGNLAGSDLSTLVIVNSGCGETFPD